MIYVLHPTLSAMFNASGVSIPSVLIVQNKSGSIFIVDNESEKDSTVQKILKKKLEDSKTKNTKQRRTSCKPDKAATNTSNLSSEKNLRSESPSL